MRKFLLVCLFCLCLVFPALAQAQNEVFCGELSESDCQLLNDAGENFLQVEGARLDLFMRLLGENIPGESRRMSLTVAGNVDYFLPAGGEMPVLEDLSAREQAEVLADALRDLLLDIDITMRVEDGDDVVTVPLQFVIVDSVAYFNLDTVAAMSNTRGLDGWLGIELEAFLRLMADQDEDVLLNLSAETDTETIALDWSTGLAEITRLPAAPADEAVFETRLEVARLLDQPAFIDALREQMGISVLEMRRLMNDLRLLFGDSTMIFEQVVNLDDRLVQSFDLSYELSPSGDVQQALFGASARRNPLEVLVEFEMGFSAFDEPLELEAPDDVLYVLNYAMLQGLMNGNTQLS
jgi:hypothetical protein